MWRRAEPERQRRGTPLAGLKHERRAATLEAEQLDSGHPCTVVATMGHPSGTM